MRSSTRQVVGLSAMIALLAPMTCFGPNYFLNLHTSYCPLVHKLREHSVCVVLDTDGSRTLIQHADLESEDRYLEIHTDAASSYFALPQGQALAPQGYTARLVPGGDTTILMDGRLTHLTPRT